MSDRSDDSEAADEAASDDDAATKDRGVPGPLRDPLRGDATGVERHLGVERPLGVTGPLRGDAAGRRRRQPRVAPGGPDTLAPGGRRPFGAPVTNSRICCCFASCFSNSSCSLGGRQPGGGAEWPSAPRGGALPGGAPGGGRYPGVWPLKDWSGGGSARTSCSCTEDWTLCSSI